MRDPAVFIAELKLFKRSSQLDTAQITKFYHAVNTKIKDMVRQTHEDIF